LAKKNNKFVNLEIENIYKEAGIAEEAKTSCDNINSNNANSLKAENMLKHKFEDINKKFDFLIKENKELKKLIEFKTKGISKINTSMNLFRKEIANLKTAKPIFKKKTPIKNTTFNKSNKFKKEKDIDELLRLGKIKTYIRYNRPT
jgi:predicted nuclease with TOPRIM domain